MATKKTAKKSADSVPVTPVPKKAAKVATKAVARKAAAPAAKSPKASAKKSAAPKAPAKPSPDAIARAAYLNYRRRVEQGLPGDTDGDWLEAERHFSGTGGL
jgi:hypothetical protein